MNYYAGCMHYFFLDDRVHATNLIYCQRANMRQIVCEDQSGVFVQFDAQAYCNGESIDKTVYRDVWLMTRWLNQNVRV